MELVPHLHLRYDHVDSSYLDCINNNIAVLLAFMSISDLRTPFACQWYFDFDPHAHKGEPLLAYVPIEKMIMQLTGCRVKKLQFEADRYIETSSEYFQAGQPILIFGDAYFMPWLPYFGCEHMEHTFIIDGLNDARSLLHIVDAYHNRTEWGEALPIDTYIPASALKRMIEALDSENTHSFNIIIKEKSVNPVNWRAFLQDNVDYILTQVRDSRKLQLFSHYYANSVQDIALVQQFVLACWQISRARMLHGLWLRDVARLYPNMVEPTLAEQFLQEVGAPWQRVSEFAYLLFRRVRQGRKPIDTPFQMLEQTIEAGEIRAAEQLAKSLDHSLVMA